MHALADIASGNTDTADVLFLIAAIIFGLAAIAHLVPAGRSATPPAPLWWLGAAIPAGLCLLSVAWLVL
jgi:TRAP-type C4-dicarboxylate transport system permease small subunit